MSPKAPPRKRKRRSPPASRPRRVAAANVPLWRRLAAASVALLAPFAVSLGSLWVWSRLGGPGEGRAFSIAVPTGASAAALSEHLLILGASRSPRLFQAYLALLNPRFAPMPGEHLLNDGNSPHQLVERLSRGSGRTSELVTLPEGFQFIQVGQRLEHSQVCTLAAFRRAVNDAALLREVAIEGVSAEGYLFPASYRFLADSDAREVIRVLVAETKRRLRHAFDSHPGRMEQLTREYGFHERDVLTLASMIEKEAQAPDERALIASVFFNRLRDPDFRPVRMLQSDPTASYGCVVLGAEVPTCVDFHGAVTPSLLRDAANPYNTYRHAGLPPGPIANPGVASIEAVLAPVASDFLYFVAKGGGRHSFSRTFAEHREALETQH